ncbi:MAG: hypothetical protein AAGI92_10395 [Pseudomonadota bacterium]
MRMTTLTLAAAFAVSATAASACGWSGAKQTVAEAPANMTKMTHKMEVAKAAPVDAWLIKYLEEWQKA